MLSVVKTDNDLITVPGCSGLDLGATLHCGQAFCWSYADEDGAFSAVVGGRRIRVRTDVDGNLIISGPGVGGSADYYLRYFDVDRDYDGIKRILSRDPGLADAIRFSPGIHILRQDPWEALGSFIFSSNNNITRIRGMIDKFCSMFGAPAAGGGYCFPSAERVAGLQKHDLAPLRCGYRDDYILDAAARVASGDIDLDAIDREETEYGRRELMRVRGVGPKVADCVLLFGFGKLDAFPLDVHMKRVMRESYPNGLPSFALPYAGIAQQYLFHRQRTGPRAAALK